MPGQELARGLDERLRRAFGWRVERIAPAGRVWFLSTPAGPKCLKRSRLSREELSLCHAALTHLDARGFEPAVQFCATLDGLPYVEAGGALYTVTAWLPGRELSYKLDSDTAAAAAVLARMHQASAGFAPPLHLPLRVAYGTWPERFRARLAELTLLVEAVARRGPRTAFDFGFLAAAPERMRAGEEAVPLLIGEEYVKAVAAARRTGTFCHHDPAPHNFLAGPEGLRMLDFDYLLCDIPLHDLASLVKRALKARDWDPRAARAALDGYAAVTPLPDGWPKLLAGFLAWPQEFWRVAHQYYVERLPWPEGRYLTRLAASVRPSEGREVYLASLAARS